MARDQPLLSGQKCENCRYYRRNTCRYNPPVVITDMHGTGRSVSLRQIPAVPGTPPPPEVAFWALESISTTGRTEVPTVARDFWCGKWDYIPDEDTVEQALVKS